MPHPIVEIDELVRPIIKYLVEISPETTASFALTCRSLEEPALSSLWKLQSSLIVLVKVLPQLTWVEEEDRFAIENSPPPEDWDRLRRHASWMRELVLGGEVSEDVAYDTLFRLSCNSPGGVLCPNLEELKWEVNVSCKLLPFIRFFLSPRSKLVDFHTRLSPFGIPGRLPFLPEIILCLPASLEHLFFMCDLGGEYLTDAVSSLIFRCGSSLKSFGSNIRLSETAIRHLVQPPNLGYWFSIHGPPRTVLPSVFPSLERLHLGKPAALPWLHLFAAREEGKYPPGFTPATAIAKMNIKETLWHYQRTRPRQFLSCPLSALLRGSSSSTFV